jgi:hypothetical protein
MSCPMLCRDRSRSKSIDVAATIGCQPWQAIMTEAAAGGRRLPGGSARLLTAALAETH